MIDVKYKVNSLKYKFAKTVLNNPEESVFASMVLGVAVGISGAYAILDKSEDSIATDKAPQVIKNIKQDISSLSKQAQRFEYARNYTVENGKEPYSKEKKKKMKDNFNSLADKVFARILIDSNLSEEQASELWELATMKVPPKSVSGAYKNDYDFGFLKEARDDVLHSEKMLTANARTISEAISKQMTAEKADAKDCSLIGVLGILSFVPFFFFADSKRFRAWEENPPKRETRKRRARFEH